MSERPRVAILASGSGSTAEAFLRGIREGVAEVDAPLVITNNPSAGIRGRVAALNGIGNFPIITAEVINGRTHPGEAEPGVQTEEEAEAIAALLRQQRIEHIFLAGYMKKVIGTLFEEFDTFNTHPGLLPATKGLHGIHVQEFAIAEGHEFAGQTLHRVDENYDTGKKIAEHRVTIRPDHTPETLFADVQVVEKSNIAWDIDHYLHS